GCKGPVMEEVSRNLKSRVRHSCEDLVNWKTQYEESLEKETRHLEMTKKLIKDQCHNLSELHLTVERLNMRIEQEQTAKELLEPIMLSTEIKRLQIEQAQEQVKFNQTMIIQNIKEIKETHKAANSELQSLANSFNQLTITHNSKVQHFRKTAEEKRSLALAQKKISKKSYLTNKVY
ncbi:unnamed protein product, partial [Meganyctiphanes norvegica]